MHETRKKEENGRIRRNGRKATHEHTTVPRYAPIAQMCVHSSRQTHLTNLPLKKRQKASLTMFQLSLSPYCILFSAMATCEWQLSQQRLCCKQTARALRSSRTRTRRSGHWLNALRTNGADYKRVRTGWQTCQELPKAPVTVPRTRTTFPSAPCHGNEKLAQLGPPGELAKRTRTTRCYRELSRRSAEGIETRSSHLPRLLEKGLRVHR